MKLDHDHVVPSSPCPSCSYVVARAAGGAASPDEGDVTVCINCAAILQFGKNLELTLIDLESLKPDELDEALAVRRTILRVNRVR